MALRNSPRLAEATRSHIREEAEKLGYRPNALVSALMAQVRSQRLVPQGEVVAFVTAFPEKEGWRASLTLCDCFAGARAQAAKIGYQVENHWLGPLGAQSRQAARVMRARSVRGMILAPMPLDVEPLALDWDHQAAVAVGISFQQKPLHRVQHNQVEGVMLCYQALRERGYKRIGFAIREEADARVHHHWGAGFLGAQHFQGGEKIPMLLLAGGWHGGPTARTDFLKWFENERPDAIISAQPDLPLRWLREIGVAVPDEVAYASLDIGSDQAGEIAGVRQQWDGIGAAAMDVVAGRLNANDLGLPAAPRLTSINGKWCDGSTVASRD